MELCRWIDDQLAVHILSYLTQFKSKEKTASLQYFSYHNGMDAAVSSYFDGRNMSYCCQKKYHGRLIVFFHLHHIEKSHIF
jgi:hypothetical protein